MATLVIILLLLLFISHVFFLIYFIRFRSNLKTLLKKLSTYDEFQDIDIKHLRDFTQELSNRINLVITKLP